MSNTVSVIEIPTEAWYSLLQEVKEVKQMLESLGAKQKEDLIPAKCTIKEVAKHSGYSESTIRNKVTSGEIKSTQRMIGGTIWISRDEVLRIRKKNQKAQF